MKHFLALILLCTSLAACNGTPQSDVAPTQTANPYSEIVLNSKEVAPIQLDYTPSTASETLYYDTQGQFSPTTQQNGYYRQILGKTADGRLVAQDFYQANQKPQTAPFIIMKEGDPKIFDKSVLDSRVIWYDQQTGDITSTATFQNGTQQGWLDVYEFNQLQLQLKDRDGGIDIRYFSPDEQIWGEAHLRQNLNTGNIALEKLDFFHPNGKILSRVKLDELRQPKGVETFDPQGKPASAQDNAKLNEIMLRRFARLMSKLPSLMAR